MVAVRYTTTTDYNKTDGHSPTTRKLTGHNLRKTQIPLSLTNQYTHCQQNFHKHHTDGMQTSTTYQRARCIAIAGSYLFTLNNNIRRENTCDPALKLINKEITSDIQKHKQNLWKEHIYVHWDHRHNTHIIWKTIYGLSNSEPPATLTGP